MNVTIDNGFVIVGGGRGPKGDSAPISLVKRYKAILSQSGSNDPIATVLENTLGGDVIWTREDVGRYLCTVSNSVFTEKTIGVIHAWGDDQITIKFGNIVRQNENYCYLTVLDISGAFADNLGVGIGVPLTIEVYP